MGATYGVGKRSTQKYEAGFEAGAKYINAKRDEIGQQLRTIRCQYTV